MTSRTAPRPDPEETYWRIQDAGHPLSRWHRSCTWSEDDEDEGEVHEGTSVVEGCHRLHHAQPNLHVGDVEIVELEGDEVGAGWDGEPCVIPTRELRRLRITAAQIASNRDRLPLPRECSPEALLAIGWSEVETMEVVD